MLAVGVGVFLVPKRMKCLTCGHRSKSGDATSWSDPALPGHQPPPQSKVGAFFADLADPEKRAERDAKHTDRMSRWETSAAATVAKREATKLRWAQERETNRIEWADAEVARKVSREDQQVEWARKQADTKQKREELAAARKLKWAEQQARQDAKWAERISKARGGSTD